MKRISPWIVAAVASWLLHLAASRFYAAELLNSLRVQMAGVAFVLALVMVRRPRPRRWIVAMLCMGIVPALVSIGPDVTPGSDAGNNLGPPLRLISFNVLTSNRRHADVVQWLLEQDADVIALIETDSRWTAAVEPILSPTHPHRVTHQPSGGNFGMCLFSRLPLIQASVRTPDSLDTGFFMPEIDCVVDRGGVTYRILVTHPLPPMRQSPFASRNHQIDQAARWARQAQQSPGEVIVVGDFNATPWSPILRRFRRTSGLNRAATMGPAVTWSAARSKTAWLRQASGLTIDHVWLSPRVSLMGYRVGPALGSDHRPLMVEVAAMIDPSTPPDSLENPTR